MEVGLLTIPSVLCVILLLKLLYQLRLALLWRVNCWFCNTNFWVKYPERNSWTCRHCEQYNGFTTDGDYNKVITTANDQIPTTPKVFQKSSPKNGLCKMCNINQQLKVTQMANFVPMNDKNFEEEIESYRMQLEKAYKLCSPCRKYLQNKLYKEKQTLLGSKLLESRSPEKKTQNKNRQNTHLKTFVNNCSMLISCVLFILVIFEFYRNIKIYRNLSSTFNNLLEIVTGLQERIYSIIKMKTLMTFPSLEKYVYTINNVIYLNMLPKSNNLEIQIDEDFNLMVQRTLGGIVCLIQIIGNIWNVNNLKHTIMFDLLWSVFVMSNAHTMAIDPIYISLIKIASVITLLGMYKYIKKISKNATSIIKRAKSKNKQNLSNGLLNSSIPDEDTLLDTDDDVSLSKFGLHNCSESSNETSSNSLMNGGPFSPKSGRCFTPKSGRSFSPKNNMSFSPNNDSIWNKPRLNSTFCVNSVICKSPSSVSDSVFVKPKSKKSSFKKYQKHKYDSDSDELDESISSLCISSPTKTKKKPNSVFSLRKFNATPNFVAPTPMPHSRPLISPSKLGYNTSWVAGGYWGSEVERQNVLSIDGSRSSSQSSGFESQTSSMNQRNVLSQPPSRETSICGEPMVLDRFSSVSNCQTPQSFTQASSPVFPKMQYNSHVHIPQARFSHQNMGHRKFFNQQQQYVQNRMFKAPGGSGLIKLPEDDSFST